MYILILLEKELFKFDFFQIGKHTTFRVFIILSLLFDYLLVMMMGAMVMVMMIMCLR